MTKADYMPVLDLPAPTRGTLERVDLEELWNDELKCQSKHEFARNPICSVVVTHRVTWCGGAFFFCQLAADRNYEFMEIPGSCGGCGKLAKDCWKLYPL